MNIGEILTKRFPGKRWILDGGDSYENLIWLDEGDKPSLKSIESEWESVQVEVHNEKAKNLRRAAYREESDPIFFDYQRGELQKEDWESKVQEIKDRYPYISIS